MEYSVFVLFSLCLFPVILVRCEPQACTYSESTYTYECNARNWNLPLEFTQFNFTPQVLKIVNTNGELPYEAPNGPTFMGFEAIDTSTFKPDVAPSLIIECFFGSQLIMTSGTFANMSYVSELYIVDCKVLNLALSVFSNIEKLNVLSFERGSIDGINVNAFSGLDILPMSGIPNPRGLLRMKNSELVEKQLPNGVLFALANIDEIIIENAALGSVQGDMFWYNKKMTKLSLSQNTFTTLNSVFFDGMNAISTIEMFGINWDCSCANLWFLNSAKAKNITFHGDIVCASPDSYKNWRGRDFFEKNCVPIDICGQMPGVVYNNECMNVFDLTSYIVFPVTLILSGVAFAMMLHFKRTEMDGIKDKIQGGTLPPPPPYSLRPLSGSKWNKVFIRDDSAQPKVEPTDSYNVFKAMSKSEEAQMSQPDIDIENAALDHQKAD